MNVFGSFMRFFAPLLALGLVLGVYFGAPAANPWFMLGEAQSTHAAEEPLAVDWSFEGPFGTFERASAQRGLQVYREVCASCHTLEYVAFRNLTDLGFTEDEVKALAMEYQVQDGPNDQGEMFERPGTDSDYFPSPYPNEEASRAANNGAYPPNLSLITKAREQGPDYVYSLLQGYRDPPAPHSDAEAADIEQRLSQGQYYNPYHPNQWFAMPQPLYPDQVAYTDGTQATVNQMSTDVTEFLHWTAEMKLEERKETGLRVMFFLAFLTVLLYLVKRRIWADVEK